MKKKIYIFSLLSLILILCGCGMGNNPKSKVETVLNRYQNNSGSIESELDDYLKTLTIDDTYYDDYKKVYIKQYQDLKYEIKDEKINGDIATVNAEIDVYDYYKTENDVKNYISTNQNDFMENGIYSSKKALKYKIDKLNTTTSRVKYNITFHLTKVDDDWTVDNLSNEDLEKIHGVYAH